MLGEQRPFTNEQHHQSMAAMQREWDAKWAPLVDTYADELRDQFALPPLKAEPVDEYAELMVERQATRSAIVRHHVGQVALSPDSHEGSNNA